MSSLDPKRGLPAYDCDCGFCAYWVRHWRRVTGDRVRYAPYQDILAQHPEVQAEAFARAIQLFEADGARYSAAKAAFRVLARAPGRGAGLWLYRRLPGFARLAEQVYALVAGHRGAAYRASRPLWGAERYPPSYHLVSWLLLRLLGLVYLAGFVSLASQIPARS